MFTKPQCDSVFIPFFVAIHFCYSFSQITQRQTTTTTTTTKRGPQMASFIRIENGIFSAFEEDWWRDPVLTTSTTHNMILHKKKWRDHWLAFRLTHLIGAHLEAAIRKDLGFEVFAPLGLARNLCWFWNSTSDSNPIWGFNRLSFGHTKLTR